MQIQKEHVKKILCIKLRGIGDVILSSVVFENLRTDFPGADIDYLTEPPSKGALEKLDFINEVVVLDRKRKYSSLHAVREVRKRKYDLVLDFYSNPRTALITFLSGARYRAGFPYKGRNYAYNLKGPSDRNKYHAARLHVEFLKEIGLSHKSDSLHFGLDVKDTTFAEKTISSLFNNNKPVVGISPSGGWPSKKCDPAIFAEICDAIAGCYDVNTLVLWGPGDRDEALKIKELARTDVTLAPDSTIRQMGALLSRCSFAVANDSGPMHIAAAVGTPVLSIHGPTDPNLQGPYGPKHEWIRKDDLECICCNLLVCPRNQECFTELEISSIMEKIKVLISKNKLNITANEKNRNIR